VFISRLRAKLRRPGGPEYIQTERGLGYRFIKGQKSQPTLHDRGPEIGGPEAPATVWLANDRIDPSPETRNARRVYRQSRLQELADSIREHGVLEPILVIPVGDRYEVVAGNRRLQAARLAGLERMPAIVRADLDEPRRLLVNLVENAQRVDLNATERIGAVQQLAAAGLGVREIARGTGLSAATVSRWTRIAGNKPLLSALEDGRIDLFRAMYLAPIQEPSVLEGLIALAPQYAPEDFYALVQQRSVATSNTDRRKVARRRRFTLLAERLAAVQTVSADSVEPLRRIVETASALLQRALAVEAERSPEVSLDRSDLKVGLAKHVNGLPTDQSPTLAG
jgi:ParB family chromosome partitioning protein